MLKHLALATAALGLLAAPAQAEETAEEPVEMTRGEEKLAKLLEGREAGEPRQCIRTFGSRNLTQIDGTALAYRDGKTIWVNYTRNPESIDDSDVMVIRRFDGTSLCRTDQIHLVDRFSGFFSGVIFLDEFVPYNKVDAEG
ncbi:hypothetical protein [Erythrobacter sp. AP23]|uniref:hypothetical protein n=1 Tax=Erythrobacter sp. AP23 TaxID=499656 RepID=UPI00076D8F23|nr:hypothetical protein [Erythrobacter sp. AP23]KWV95038.1 hypothetical protein ASS64_07595 [Erythrobacter sp. AP23]